MHGPGSCQAENLEEQCTAELEHNLGGRDAGIDGQVPQGFMWCSTCMTHASQHMQRLTQSAHALGPKGLTQQALLGWKERLCLLEQICTQEHASLHMLGC